MWTMELYKEIMFFKRCRILPIVRHNSLRATAKDISASAWLRNRVLDTFCMKLPFRECIVFFQIVVIDH